MARKKDTLVPTLWASVRLSDGSSHRTPGTQAEIEAMVKVAAAKDEWVTLGGVQAELTACGLIRACARHVVSVGETYNGGWIVKPSV